MRTAVLSILLALPGAAAAHPGHGALEVHWHAGDLLWAALGAAALAGIGWLVRRRIKR